ncbi:helix-turn-helix domain-containing protein [Candidatus Poribacteria bacterium]|jgi:excisionase family DNA binding protein|nr:helix-turn-helix domain-containing protein [Candidatus Poribacteria bacterium]MBT5535926.1 helix-turn-helix domain-containing protein [Candidatus Poribacteria bacterium]MBT5711233.1 helix-turn-helix domain-containing protein [Candidatus Poribacteria bacterium]MBT7100632.1 helix-turn-helix domain-containing protein [Candidatus Poribacteria bacterium]MBT7809080.1 helix-turn-helix domain-containing protein [Candidatus Poribacteria bacterium]
MESRRDRTGGGQLVKVEDIAEMLGVSAKTVYGWVYEGTIPFVKPTRGTLRFRVRDIEAWLEQRTHRPHE